MPLIAAHLFLASNHFLNVHFELVVPKQEKEWQNT